MRSHSAPTVARGRSAGDREPAIELARRVVDADRYDTHAHELLIELLVQAGHASHARAAHEAWAAAMDELDIPTPPFRDG